MICGKILAKRSNKSTSWHTAQITIVAICSRQPHAFDEFILNAILLFGLCL